MRSKLTLSAVALLVVSAIAGCQSANTYHPAAEATNLAATAATTKYPSDLTAERAPDVFYTIADNGVITLYNAGDASFGTFTLWTNKSYSLVVDKLPAHTWRNIPPDAVYNRAGSNLQLVSVNTITPVEIEANGHLYSLAGPMKPME